ncbi:hypothetical protein Pint_03058 [Pistacia integerrima]|uniref:Uncharacterized protein n=1 Tax=Pistacia integerrima TaxID=434235 RepID=A0ACC0ZK05_9ROSI|nr:hypothetical protein Pint_03058 [Pistacia integerrima]
MTSTSGKPKGNPNIKPVALWTEERPPATTTLRTQTTTSRRRSFVEEEKKKSSEEGETIKILKEEELEEDERKRKSLKNYFDEAKNMVRSDSGPPRWFSPLECESHTSDSPVLFYLPGIDGVGLGLIRQHELLGKIFDVWCLHIPAKDRTSFTGLVKMIEKSVRSENCRSPNKPIYIVGDSLGACLALAVAARNPDLDLVLILANPGTSFSKSVLQSTEPLLILTDILPKETLLWKLELLKSASAYANARLQAVKAQTLILCSGRDQLLPSQEEGQRLRRALPKCQTHSFDDNGHFLFLVGRSPSHLPSFPIVFVSETYLKDREEENRVDLVTIIKSASYYRRGRNVDYVSDYMPPTITEFNKIYEQSRWFTCVTSPVMLSTLEDGKIVMGLSGIPAEGPVLFVGYHNLIGIELAPMIPQFMIERNILVRGVAHPMIFFKLREGKLPDLGTFDIFRAMGAVPVSGKNLYKLMASKSHALLYPGGMREALHRKGEEYKLFWPETSEFVRMAARFGAKIIPFGAVGEDDFAQVVFDYDDQKKIPFFGSGIEEKTNETVKLRSDTIGEVANQPVHMPYCIPKVPGRFYYYFGKPIQTQGRESELRDRKKAQELYLEVKSEVENCLAYLREKREKDPYRNILARFIHKATHGFTSEVPTFEL